MKTEFKNVGDLPCVECQNCLFKFSAEHADDDGWYVCPICVDPTEEQEKQANHIVDLENALDSAEESCKRYNNQQYASREVINTLEYEKALLVVENHELNEALKARVEINAQLGDCYKVLEAKCAQLHHALERCYQQLQDQQAMPDSNQDHIYEAALGLEAGKGWASPERFAITVKSLEESQAALQRWIGSSAVIGERMLILDKVAKQARYAAAELRHIYRAKFITKPNNEISQHDDGLVSRAVRAIEVELSKLDKFDSFKAEDEK